MKIILNNGGTRKGLSHFARYTEDPCMRRVTLDAQAKALAGASGGVMNEGAYRGILFHKLAELYHTDKLDAESIETGLDFVKENGEPAREATPKAIFEALRLAEYWFRHVPRRGLGNVINAELHFPLTEVGKGALAMALGPETDLTGQADLVTEIRSASQAADIDRMFTDMGSPLGQPLDPGVWLWDFKTVTDAGNSFRYEYGWQEIAYPWLFALDNPGVKVNGMIYIVLAIGRRKVPLPAVETIIHPFPSDEKIGSLIRHLQSAERVRKALMVDQDSVNRKRCAPKFRDDPWCPWMTNGTCSGY